MSMFACFGGRKRSSRAVDYWDCSNLGLTDLPKEVQQHRKTLRQLFMSNNNIRDVPKSLFTCEHLTELDLSENMILFLPPSIQALRFLTSLNISKNSLSTVPDSIRECQDLLYLDISSNSLGSLPDGVTELRQLRTLSLNDCQLEELPPNIGRLNKLEVLELRENLLNSLPQSMCHMTLLEKLDLGVNELETLGAVIGALESLSELWLDGNLLNSLPDAIGSLRNLKFLEVSENQVMSLPLTISGLVSLQDLYLPDNLLPLLPESIGELVNLRMLKIERNRLSALPETIYGWRNMVELSASHNHLEEIPEGLGALRKLEILNMDENSLFSLPPELGQLTSLSVLSVRDNNLVELPPEVGQLKKLTILNLVGNRLQNLPYSLTSLENLTAVWIAENQNRPLLDLQLSRDQGGEKVLTCILLPQHGTEPPFEEPSQAATSQATKTHVSSVNFDPKVQDRKSNLTRDPTPFPKELHIKALQWRAMREEMGGGTPERVGVGDVNLRHGRRALHRPYSLIRAMSDPIDEDNLFPNSHRGSRRRDGSRERRDYSLTPPIRTQSPLSPSSAVGEGERRGCREHRTHSSPSPPLLAPLQGTHQREKAASLPPDHRRMEADYPVRMLPNGQYAPETAATPFRDALSPTHTSGSDDHTALLANSNSSNGNWHSSVPVRETAKSSHGPQTGHHPPPPTSPPRLYYQSNAQGHSETSTLSRSDIPDPRCSSSMESGFDADVEPDQNFPWYLTSDSSPNHSEQRNHHHKKRFLSDSSTPSTSASRGRRGSSGDDYDHLRDKNEGRGKKPFPKLGYKGSPIATGKPKVQLHSINYQHKPSRSFDTAESAAQGKHAGALPRSELHFAKGKVPQKSYTAAMKGKKGSHARSRSQPEELVRLNTSMPVIAVQRSTRGSQSPTHLVSYHARSATPTQQPQGRSEHFPRAHSPSAQHHTALQESIFGEDSVFQSPSHEQRRPGSVSPAHRHQIHSPVRPFSPSSSFTATAGSNHRHTPRPGSHRQQIEDARRGREGDREAEGGHGLPNHQRFPSDSYYTSDESQGLGPEQISRRTPTKGCGTWGVSQDSGFDSMKRNTLSPPPGAAANSGGTVIKVELVKDPTLGLGITGGVDGNNTIKPGDTSYHIYKIADGSPAKTCGKVAVGDKLLEVNGTDVSALKTSELLSLINSETHISLTLFREPSMTLL